MIKLLLISLLLSLSIISCNENNDITDLNSVPVTNQKEFLDHIRLNDSIEYKIKEYNAGNSIKRDLCVFKNGKIIKEHPIYFARKKEILDEGYNTTSKKKYTSLNYDLIEIQDITFHYFNYLIESIDTSTSYIEVTEKGEIILKHLTL
jgi:hypothetical protein